jgi:hypothetical protein
LNGTLTGQNSANSNIFHLKDYLTMPEQDFCSKKETVIIGSQTKSTVGAPLKSKKIKQI